MDKQATLGFILIGLVMLVWMWLQAPAPQPAQPVAQDTTVVQHHEAAPPAAAPETRSTPPQPASSAPDMGKYFGQRTSGTEKLLVVETDLYRAEISSRGGAIRSWVLKKYLTWDKRPVDLVVHGKGGDFGLLFTSSDGRLINTKELYFDAGFSNNWTVTLSGEANGELVFN